MTGLAAVTPSRIASTPAPVCCAPYGSDENSPMPSAVTPTTTSTTPNQNRRCRDSSGNAMSSRIAWTGAIREVRRAGSHAAATVTTSPTAYAATTVRGANTSDCPDRSSPKLPNSVRMPSASSTPRPRPTVEPIRPTTDASNSTDPVTWRVEAPSARSRASSRLRWATRIENVLTIRNAPTTRAIPAKISRKVWMNPIACFSSEADSSAALSPVTASYPSGSTSATRSRRSSWETPSSAVTQMSLNASSPSRNSSWAVRVSKIASVAPLSDPPFRKSAMPTSVGSSRAVLPAVRIGIRSPTS